MRDYRQNLTEGKPCPLCGAVHHPLIAAREEENEKAAGSTNFRSGTENNRFGRLEGEIKFVKRRWKSLTERKNAALPESIRQEEFAEAPDGRSGADRSNASTLAERQAVLQKMQTEIYSRCRSGRKPSSRRSARPF